MKRKKRGLISILIFTLLFLVFIWYFFFYDNSTVQETTILKSDSPNHTNQIEIKVWGENDLLTNAPIRIYYGRKGNLKKYKEYQIENDGKKLYPRNFIITWNNEDQVSIILIGEEQKNEEVEINL